MKKKVKQSKNIIKQKNKKNKSIKERLQYVLKCLRKKKLTKKQKNKIKKKINKTAKKIKKKKK